MIKPLLSSFFALSLSSSLLIHEVRSIYAEFNLGEAKKNIQKFLKEESFLSPTDYLDYFSKIETTLKKTAYRDSKSSYELGKTYLLKGIKSSVADEKLYSFCMAREQFKRALLHSPRDLEYNLALADVESISPHLSVTCNNTYATSSTQSEHNVEERLLWIEHLAPNDPPTLYKKGLIEKAQGNRLKAMTSFRGYEEKSLSKNEATRQYLIQEIQNEEELTHAIPEKYPHTLQWYADYRRIGNTSLAFEKIFEKKMLAMLHAIANNHAEGKIKSSELLSLLTKIRQTPHTSGFVTFETEVNALLFKHISLQTNDQFQAALYKKLSERKRAPFAIAQTLSGTTKKNAILSQWNTNNSQENISVDLRASGFFIYLPEEKETNLLIFQSTQSIHFPENTKIELWKSDTNSDYSIIQTADEKLTTGTLNEKQIGYIDLGRLQKGYYKIYFSYPVDKSITISGPIEKIIQLYN